MVKRTIIREAQLHHGVPLGGGGHTSGSLIAGHVTTKVSHFHSPQRQIYPTKKTRPVPRLNLSAFGSKRVAHHSCLPFLFFSFFSPWNPHIRPAGRAAIVVLACDGHPALASFCHRLIVVFAGPHASHRFAYATLHRGAAAMPRNAKRPRQSSRVLALICDSGHHWTHGLVRRAREATKSNDSTNRETERERERDTCTSSDGGSRRAWTASTAIPTDTSPAR